MEIIVNPMVHDDFQSIGWRGSRRAGIAKGKIHDANQASIVLQKKHRLHEQDFIVMQQLVPLTAIFGWYEGADSRCRHKIFGDILLLAFWSSLIRARGNFPAHDAEQAFVVRHRTRRTLNSRWSQHR